MIRFLCVCVCVHQFLGGHLFAFLPPPFISISPMLNIERKMYFQDLLSFDSARTRFCIKAHFKSEKSQKYIEVQSPSSLQSALGSPVNVVVWLSLGCACPSGTHFLSQLLAWQGSLVSCPLSSLSTLTDFLLSMLGCAVCVFPSPLPLSLKII